MPEINGQLQRNHCSGALTRAAQLIHFLRNVGSHRSSLTSDHTHRNRVHRPQVHFAMLLRLNLAVHAQRHKPDKVASEPVAHHAQPMRAPQLHVITNIRTIINLN